MNNLKLTGIKAAVGEYQSCQPKTGRMPSLYVSIMIDMGTGRVWADTFSDCNSWNQYKDKNVRSVLSHYYFEQFDTVTMKTVKETCANMLEFDDTDIFGEPVIR